MQFNPYSKLPKIKERMKEMQGASFELRFSDGSVRLFTDDRIAEMLSDLINGYPPNEDAQFFLDKLEQGIEDEGGTCHLVAAYATDPNEIWGDENVT